MQYLPFGSGRSGVEETGTFKSSSAQRRVRFHPEAKEIKMAESTENRATSSKIEAIPANAGNESPLVSNIARFSIRNCDKSGDWKNDTDPSWYVDTRNDDGENTNLSPENVTEWKYRNVYSMSAHNGGQAASWSPCRTAALATAMLGNKPDEDANEGKSYLLKFRDYLANYQESYGIPRTEYTFPALIKVMGQATGRSLLALLYVVVNITPMAQILLHILRFVLDKTISIQNTNEFRQVILKYAILGLQLLCIYVCLTFIFGFIVMPILYMAIGILMKIMLYD